MAVGPWVGLGVAYAVSVGSLVRQRRKGRAARPKLYVVGRTSIPVDASQPPTLASR